MTLDVGHPDDHAGFLRAFTGVEPSGDGRRYRLEHGGRLQLESTSARNRFTGFSVGVPDLGLVARRLASQDIPFQRLPGSIVIALDQGFGARIAFESASS